MQENYEHYISRNIKLLYRKRLLAPILYLIFTAVFAAAFPIASVLFPTELSDVSGLEAMYRANDVFVSVSLDDLKFTGYTKMRFQRTIGYYYYTKNPKQKECLIVLLSPSSCEQGLPEIDHIRINGKILQADASCDALLKNLSADLAWTNSGIRDKVNPCLISEPDVRYGTGILLCTVFIAGSLFAAGSILLSLLYIQKPWLSPPCRKLGHFGKTKELLALAEEELATLPQLATEDMFITEHFFIETSKYGIAIVPIQEIIWIYKHSTLHKLFWYHFSISYTLHITANKHVYIHCPKNTKSDIDGIIDYLSEANHNILVGFSEYNRRKTHGVN